MQPNKISLELETEPVSVLIDTAIPCGLILSELISNTLKHAFPGDRAGRLSIQLDQAEDEAITLRVADNGVGVAEDFDIRKQDTLGLQTVLGIVEHQLRGEISVETESGLAWRIRFRDDLYRPRV
jgi:two-component sensor histidine kinase